MQGSNGAIFNASESRGNLVREGILKPIQFSEWATPIVPTVKPDKSVRICGDFKLTINQAAKLDRYPVPRIENLFGNLSGGQLFSKLDIRQAYQQILLKEESTAYVVINTHHSLFHYNRLPFVFARFGLPHMVVTDNPKCFTSEEFVEFLEKNGVAHVTSAPYHPDTNGLAEKSSSII